MGEPDRSSLPIRAPFQGVANRIGHVEAPRGAPNVLLVLIDDIGSGNGARDGALMTAKEW